MLSSLLLTYVALIVLALRSPCMLSIYVSIVSCCPVLRLLLVDIEFIGLLCCSSHLLAYVAFVSCCPMLPLSLVGLCCSCSTVFSCFFLVGGFAIGSFCHIFPCVLLLSPAALVVSCWLALIGRL